MRIPAGSVPSVLVGGAAPRHEQRLGDAGGMTRLGVNICTLAPGERSALRHWHLNEDEFLYMLSGEGVLVENDGEHPLRPGDACAWPAGVDNAHHVLNRSDAPLSYIVMSNLADTDRVRYPDDGLTLFHEPPRWRVVHDDGTIVREGDT